MTNSTALTGEALALWLQTQLNFFYNNPEGLEQQDLIVIVKEALESTHCIPDTPSSLFDYHRLYLAIEENDIALEMLEKFEQPIFDSLEQLNQHYFSIMVSYWKTNLFVVKDKERFLSQSERLIDNMFSYPHREHIEFIWEKLLEGCAFLGLWETYRKYFRLKVEFNPVFASTSVRYNEGQRSILVEDCFAFASEGKTEEKLNSARQLIELLIEETNQAKISEKIWLENAHAIVQYAPEVIDEMLEHINHFVKEDWHLAKKRDLTIRTSQVLARKKYAENKVDEAIALGLKANYEVSGDKNYYFTSTLINWLIESNQIEKVAKIALDAVIINLNNVTNYAIDLAFKYKETHPLVEWYIILCFYYDDLIEGSSNESNDQNKFSAEQLEAFKAAFQEAYESAKKIDSQHSSLQFLELFMLRKRKNELEQTEYHKKIIEKTDVYFSNPNNYRTLNIVCAYYRSKAFIEGIESVLNGEIIMASEATENFLVARDLFLSDEEWARYVDHREKISDLQVRVQQYAKQQFETFFETGEGYFRDANIHNYSMLLRNICVELCEPYYRTPEELMESSKRAVELSQVAISISSFAEHYYGIFTAYENLNDENAMIESAENLWQYSVRYGFSRFQPQKIANKIARPLHNQGRYKEIQIWIERLDEWYSYLDEQSKQEQNESYFFNRIFLLSHIVAIQPEESALRLEKEINSNPHYWESDEAVALNIACIYRDLKQMDKAIEFFQLALDIATKNDYQAVIEVAERNLQNLLNNPTDNTINSQNNSQKPWWKFW